MKILSEEEIEELITYPSTHRIMEAAEHLLNTARAYHQLQKDLTAHDKSYLKAVIERDKEKARSEKLKEALSWIAGKSDKPYCTYYERILENGTIIPAAQDIAEEALKEIAELEFAERGDE